MGRRRLLRLLSGLMGIVLGLAVAGFVSRPADPSAEYFPSAPTVKKIDLPATIGTSKLGAVAPRQLPAGPLYRPNPILTPGAVASTDVKAICAAPKRDGALFRAGTLNTTIPAAVQQTVFTMYRIAPARVKEYGLNYLVPLQLGGADTPNNIWPVPVSTRGLGFHEKETLNIRMHVLVCHSEMPLATAQAKMATDWIAMWVLYGTSQSLYG